MLTAKDLNTEVEYRFSIFPTTVVPSVDRAIFEGLVGLGIASSIDPGVGGRHVAAYPFLPEGAVKDPNKLQYLIFRKDNQKYVYAADWINFATMEKVSSDQASIMVLGLPQSEYRTVRILLEKNGYKVGNISPV